MIRDDELKRLIHYAKGLGVKVTIYSSHNKDGAADWALDGSEISVWSGGFSKTDTVLSLIHELGHQLYFIHEKDRQPDLKFDEAITRENVVAKVNDKKNLTPKHLRKKIYDVEAAGTAWWSVIVKETNVKIPEWRISMQMEMDIWMYEYYYEHGTFPDRTKARLKRRELRDKWKPKR